MFRCPLLAHLCRSNTTRKGRSRVQSGHSLLARFVREFSLVDRRLSSRTKFARGTNENNSLSSGCVFEAERTDAAEAASFRWGPKMPGIILRRGGCRRRRARYGDGPIITRSSIRLSSRSASLSDTVASQPAVFHVPWRGAIVRSNPGSSRECRGRSV